MRVDTVSQYKRAGRRRSLKTTCLKQEAIYAKIANSAINLVGRKSKYKILNITIARYTWIHVLLNGKI